MVVIGRPTRKCPGVSTDKSLGSSVNGQSGRELSTASICVSNVLKSSYVNLLSPIYLSMVRFMWCLVDLTPASHNPPKWGALGGMKCHCVPSDINLLLT